MLGSGFPWLDVLVFPALRKRPGPAEQDRQLMVEVVAKPYRHAGARLEPEGFPGMPEGGQPGDGLRVLPPLPAPSVFAAERTAEHGQELAGHPLLNPAVEGLRWGNLAVGRLGAGGLRTHPPRSLLRASRWPSVPSGPCAPASAMLRAPRRMASSA